MKERRRTSNRKSPSITTLQEEETQVDHKKKAEVKPEQVETSQPWYEEEKEHEKEEVSSPVKDKVTMNYDTAILL
jgi:hypothetical protein